MYGRRIIAFSVKPQANASCGVGASEFGGHRGQRHEITASMTVQDGYAPLQAVLVRALCSWRATTDGRTACFRVSRHGPDRIRVFKYSTDELGNQREVVAVCTATGRMPAAGARFERRTAAGGNPVANLPQGPVRDQAPALVRPETRHGPHDTKSVQTLGGARASRQVGVSRWSSAITCKGEAELDVPPAI